MINEIKINFFFLLKVLFMFVLIAILITVCIYKVPGILGKVVGVVLFFIGDYLYLVFWDERKASLKKGK